MKFKVSFIFLMLILCLSSCSYNQKARELKLAHGMDINHPVHLAMVFLKQRLEKKSGGKLKLKIFPGSQLGAERETLELLQIGSLDITKVSAAVLENFIPEYKVLSVPYIFKDKQHVFKFYDSEVGASLLKKGDKFKLRGLTYYDSGTRNFYTTNRPIHTPNDLKGLKIRVQKSNMAVAMVNDLGGSPTPISYGELYTALQQGVVDGAENNLPSFYTSKHYEICKYLTMDEHTVVPDVLLIGLDTWNRLNAQEKQWLTEAARESSFEERKLWEASEQKSLKEIKAAGVQIITPDKSQFVEKTKTFPDLFKDQPESLKLIRDINNLVDQ